MTAYYNEIDPKAAQWLRNLIEAGHIAPGYVDERSIEDVYPSDLRGFAQCHFFAGIGVWSYALRAAGWADDRSVWTGSCPCQPFSAAGKGTGFDDERHLWPAFHHLIKECKPESVLGEQVASKDAGPWIDLVHTDMEALGYAFGAVPFPSAGVGAPHIRDRLYWVADTTGQRLNKGRSGFPTKERDGAAGDCSIMRLDNTDNTGLEGHGRGHRGEVGQREGAIRPIGQAGELGWLGNADEHGAGRVARAICGAQAGEGWWGCDNDAGRTGPTNGYWSDADWLYCRDGKWRPVEPGTFPLVAGAANRVGRLRGYGNAINAKAAQAFIEAVMEAA